MVLKDVKVKKLSVQNQRDLMVANVIFTFVVIYLLKIYWEPMIFFGVASYIILNKDKALTANELFLLFGVAKPILMYAILARYVTMTGALVFVVPYEIAIVLIYLFSWRKNR